MRRIIAIQATAAALPAVVPGATLGYYLAAHFGDLLVGIGLLRNDQPLVHGPIPAVAALLLLWGVVRVAAWAATLRISRMPVISGLPEPHMPSRVRTNAGLLLILVSLVLATAPLLVQTEAAAVGPANSAILAVIGLAMAGPRLVQWVTEALAGSRLMAKVSGPAWLAVTTATGTR
ncbi:hypothetical protein ACFXJ8_41430 [Nonomuraea sp. NPDC059194]|uniref:hypothetical protein n=1 Tax=Nonomuraea sp. NPDC059194 TaxID=3346764 RepID=UPI0036BAB5F7